MAKTRMKLALARAITHPLLGRLERLVLRERIRYRGVSVFTQPDVVTDSMVAALFSGLYESAEARFVRRHLPSTLDVVELGASIGAVSSLIASRLAEGRRLLCVEANPTLLPLLERNTRRFEPRVHVHLENCAIVAPAADGFEVALDVGASNIVGRLAIDVAVSTQSRINVRGRSLDALLAEHDVGEFALVSDIEGAEASFILGDPHMLARCKFALLELHATQLEARSYSAEDLARALVERHGFSIVARHGPVVACAR